VNDTSLKEKIVHDRTIGVQDERAHS